MSGRTLSAQGLVNHINLPPIRPLSWPRRFTGLVLPAAVLSAWWVVSALALVPGAILPSPAEVFYRGFELLQSGELGEHIWASVSRLLLGLGLGFVIGAGAGLWTGISKAADEYISPTLKILTPVPVLAWMPLIVLFLGVGEAAKIALMALGVFFMVFASTYTAIRSISASVFEVAQMLGKGPRSIMRHLVVPYALPGILDGLQGALALSWVVLVAAEMVSADKGLGWLIWDARTFGRTSDAYVAMIVVGALGFLGNQVVRTIKCRLLLWRVDFGGL